MQEVFILRIVPYLHIVSFPVLVRIADFHLYEHLLFGCPQFARFSTYRRLSSLATLPIYASRSHKYAVCSESHNTPRLIAKMGIYYKTLLFR
jgi:hypothetical protein